MAQQPTDPTKTRKDAQLFTVTDPAEAIGFYLAEDLTKTWIEDFTDGDTGEVVSINRCDIIKRRGELITPDIASSLIFFIQTGDVTEIKISDQRRQASEYNTSKLKPYKVTASINGKRHQFILEAQTVELALEVARDWIELNYNGDFTIIGASALLNVVLLNSTLERFNDETGESEEISGSGESDGETTRYYKADAEVKITYFGEDEPRDVNFTFIVKTLDVDTAKAAATAWIAARMKDSSDPDHEISSVKTTLTSATPLSCTALINRAFCEAYRVLTD